MNSSLSRIFVPCLLLFCPLVTAVEAKAQITSDGTLPTPTEVNPQEGNPNVSEITGGTARGSNLFHSFQEFSVDVGSEAFFNNTDTISNIISRVTGGNVSNINGAIRANDASLFLINPAGIIFGAGASLNLGGGSFYGSTADSLLFPEGEFSAVNPDSTPVLTINAPIGLSFRDNPASIVNNSLPNDNSTLSVSPGATLALLGGEINFNGGEIVAPGANIFIGGLSESGTISLDENLTPNFPEGIALANVTLRNGAMVDVRADGGGSISVNARNFNLSGGSQLIAGIDDAVNDPAAQAGDINLNITESITIDGAESGIFNNVGEEMERTVINDEGEEEQEPVPSNAVGNAGKINIETGSLSITPGGRIGSTVFGRGNAGDVTVNARENIEIQGFEEGSENRQNPTGIFSNLEFEAQGNSGTIDISSNSLFLTDRGQLRTSIARGAEGTAGDILVNTESLTLDDSGTRFTTLVAREARGTSGNIVINADTVTFTAGSLLSSELLDDAEGSAGDITINANSLTLNSPTLKENSRAGNTIEIQTEVEDGAIGDAGDITINTTDTVSLSGTSRLQTTIKGGAQGNAGNITIDTGTLILDNDARIQNTTGRESIGNAGRVEINADTVEINNGSKIQSFTRGEGNAGTIEINASNLVTISGFGDLLLLNRPRRDDSGNITANNIVREGGSSGLFASVAEEASGRGGNITISTPSLQLLDGAVISASVSAEAEGQGGSIVIDADTLKISDGGQIIASSLGNGDSGQIELNIRDSINISGSDPLFSQRFRAEERTRESGEITFDGFLTEAEGRAEFDSFVGTGDESQISGIFANTGRDATGDAGSITIGSETQPTSEVFLSDRGTIAVDSDGAGDGGNIEFFISDRLQLSGDSLISASSSTNSGGNITINAVDGFLVALPEPNGNNGNDITANAPGGTGGNITIRTQGVLGLEERAATENNGTNDIDASGQTDGIVEIITPDVDAIEADVALPNNPIESEQTVVQSCRSDRLARESGSLIITGKGGVPAGPTEPLSSDAILIDGQVVTPDLQARYPEIKPIATQYGDIMPARGVIKTANGRVILTAYPTDNIDARTPIIAARCN